MNDPKENLFHIVNYDEFVNFKGAKRDFSSDQYILAKIIQNNTRILAFSTDKIMPSNELGVFVCGNHLQRMWSSYGQNNEGICLEIDLDKFVLENKDVIEEHNIIHKKVNYDNLQFQGIPERLFGSSHKVGSMGESINDLWEKSKSDSGFIESRFFTKNLDWAGETEYRFLTFSEIKEEILLSIEKSLTKVILGLNFSKYSLPSIKALVPNDKIFVINMTIDGDFFSLEVE